MKLNGWQRLWVLIGILYLIPVLIIVIDLTPKKSQIYHDWFCALSFIANKETLKTVENIEEDDKQRILFMEEKIKNQTSLSDGSYQSKLQETCFHPDFPENDVSIVRNRYIKNLNNIIFVQIKFISTSFLYFWILPMCVLYALGWAIGWVYRGFRNK